jgi:hypothetical protein
VEWSGKQRGHDKVGKTGVFENRKRSRRERGWGWRKDFGCWWWWWEVERRGTEEGTDIVVYAARRTRGRGR